MKNKMEYVNGMPVEIPNIDSTVEEERKKLVDLALKEYEDTGALVSEKLLEANRNFIKSAGEKSQGTNE